MGESAVLPHRQIFDIGNHTSLDDSTRFQPLFLCTSPVLVALQYSHATSVGHVIVLLTRAQCFYSHKACSRLSRPLGHLRRIYEGSATRLTAMNSTRRGERISILRTSFFFSPGAAPRDSIYDDPIWMGWLNKSRTPTGEAR